MANILVLGVGPLPFEPVDRLHAPGIRTWQIASTLSRRRHFVTLCIIDFGDFHAGNKLPSGQTAVRQDLGSNISLIRLAYNPKETADAIRTLHVATRFSAIVSTTDIMNAMAADLELKVPAWFDYNGDPFAEKQLQARLYQHDGSLLPQWDLYLKGLLYGDRFSVCSEPQLHATIGQLAFAGRLTGKNAGERLVHVMPNCSRFMAEKTPVRSVPLKGTQIPATAFLALWTGGYNTWCDPETLFRGLEIAMERSPAFYFATTGGALEGHDTKSFQIFRDLVNESRFRDRFIFLGWVPTDEVGAYYEQADAALFTDRYSVEGELGTRTRIIDWIQYDIPIVCTELCELTRDMAKQDLLTTFPIGNPGKMADSLLKIAAEPGVYREKASRAKVWFEEQFEEISMLSPLLEWCEAPAFSADRKAALKATEDVSSSHPWLSNLSQIQLNGLKAPLPAVTAKRATADSGSKDSFKGRLRNMFGRKS